MSFHELKVGVPLTVPHLLPAIDRDQQRWIDELIGVVRSWHELLLGCGPTHVVECNALHSESTLKNRIDRPSRAPPKYASPARHSILGSEWLLANTPASRLTIKLTWPMSKSCRWARRLLRGFACLRE